ncbi:MAG: 6-bladed beta-propeller [Chloroflexi bacterium]|nr:6-bladed beta-propeller [Chloroflexota bacterium]
MVNVTRLEHHGWANSDGRWGAPATRSRGIVEEPLGSGEHSYYVVDNWARRPRGWAWIVVAGVAVDAEDRVFVFSRSRRPVQVYDRDGFFLDWWGDDVTTTAHGITVDVEGNVWLADTGDHTVRKFTPDGKPLLSLGTPHQSAPRMGGDPFNEPTRVAVAANGDLYVSDGYGNARIHVFSADGEYRFGWGSPGSGPGQFSNPHAVSIGPDGRVYVCDRSNRRIQVFSADGTYEEEWSGVNLPDDLAWGPDGNAYVAELLHRISIWSPQGERLAGWGDEGCTCPEQPPIPPCPAEQQAAGQVIGPHGLAVDSQGSIYVGDLAETYRGIDRGSRALQKFVRVDA